MYFKLFEKHVCSQLYEYLNSQKLLHNKQSGFRQKHSCQTALTKLIDEWLRCLDSGNIALFGNSIRNQYGSTDFDFLLQFL